MMHSRRSFVGGLGAILAVLPAGLLRAAPAVPSMQVYKSRTCGCCNKWIDHVRAAGFSVDATDVDDVQPYKRQYNVPAQLGSCHTALVERYVIEGHVPADDIIRLLRERPEVLGLAVPGMPMGSPGMEGPTAEPYDTLAFAADGTTSVFATHRP
jgi:hypothetical protein